MLSGIPLFPAQASTLAPQVDNLYFFLLAVTSFFAGSRGEERIRTRLAFATAYCPAREIRRCERCNAAAGGYPRTAGLKC